MGQSSRTRNATPGALSQAAVASPSRTICQPAYLRKLHGAGIDAREEGRLYVAYGAVGASSLYQEDRLVAVEDGGSPASALNLWPEPVSEAAAKQTAADRLHHEICEGTLTVRQAAVVLERDWTVGRRDP